MTQFVYIFGICLYWSDGRKKVHFDLISTSNYMRPISFDEQMILNIYIWK